MSQVREFVMEIDRQNVVGQIKDLEEGSQYSFDGGETWHDTRLDAYNCAKNLGTLSLVHDPGADPGEFEAFVLGLIQQVRDLAPGESFKVSKSHDNQVTVLRESMVLVCRGSTIQDVDLRMER